MGISIAMAKEETPAFHGRCSSVLAIPAGHSRNGDGTALVLRFKVAGVKHRILAAASTTLFSRHHSFLLEVFYA